MLSFLKDSSKDFSDPQDQSEQDYLTIAKHGKNLRQSTILLVILFSVGAICVWFMIKKATPATADAAPSAEENMIETAMAQIAGIQAEVDGKVDNVVGRFYQFNEVGQVGVDELKKNPFIRDLGTSSPEMPVEVDNSQSEAARTSLLREEIRRKATRLQLWSIMESPKGSCCMINEKVFYKGDTVEGFLINNITNEYVELSSNGMQFKLKISE